MPNYTKLFNSIVTSTIWTEDDKTRIVWITMLALADQNGEVHASIPGLARLAGVSIESVEEAIGKFLGPDPYSRTPDHDGRRITPIDGGWELLNHAKYRRMASLADQKENNAKRQKRHRDRNATVTDSNATVTVHNATVTLKTDKAEAEAEAEAEVESEKRKTKAKGTLAEFHSFFSEIGLPDSDAEYAFHKWEGNGWVNGKNPIKDWKATVRQWKTGKFFPSQKNAPATKTYSHANGYNESTDISHL